MCITASTGTGSHGIRPHRSKSVALAKCEDGSIREDGVNPCSAWPIRFFSRPILEGGVLGNMAEGGRDVEEESLLHEVLSNLGVLRMDVEVCGEEVREIAFLHHSKNRICEDAFIGTVPGSIAAGAIVSVHISEEGGLVAFAAVNTHYFRSPLASQIVRVNVVAKSLNRGIRIGLDGESSSSCSGGGSAVSQAGCESFPVHHLPPVIVE